MSCASVRYPGIKIHDPRVIRFLEVLLHGGTHVGGWTAKQIHHAVLATFHQDLCGPTAQRTLPLFYDKGGDGDIHLVEGPCIDHLGADRVHDSYCVLTATRQGSYFLWCTPLEQTDGTRKTWHESAHEMKEACANECLTFIPNKETGSYDARPPLIVRILGGGK